MRHPLAFVVVAAFALIAVMAAGAFACQCLAPGSPIEELAQASDVFLGTVTRKHGPFMISAGPDSYRESDVVFQFRVLASWKGARTDTISLTTGSGGGDCGYRFTPGGTYIVYGNRGKDGRLYTSHCSRTAEIFMAWADSIQLGPPPVDRLGGRSWIAFAPPANCPRHPGSLIRSSHSWVATNLTRDAALAYPIRAARQFPFAAMDVVPEDAPNAPRRSGSLYEAPVCPLCREAAIEWCMDHRDPSTTREIGGDLPVVPSRKGDRSAAAYRTEVPNTNFALSYSDGRQDLDTIDGRFTREFGGVRDTSFKLAVADSALRRIYEATVAARLFDIAGPHPLYPFATMNDRERADRALTLYVRCGTTVRQFRWYPERAPRNPSPGSEWARLMGVMREVQRVIVELPEFRALPALPEAIDDPLRKLGAPFYKTVHTPIGGAVRRN